mmetsp:Transcript_2359/g.6746  ORF Transcript_2359/g.6746 Transcript_2359/m.6746 type:complete len:236 (-) Transcript_2359:5-712(-)
MKPCGAVLIVALAARSAALSPSAVAAPPWLRQFFEPVDRPLVARPDGVRVRRGLAADAPRIKELWAENVGPCTLGDAWSAGGIETAFAPRFRDGRCRATSAVAYSKDREMVGFAAATASDEPFNNVGPLVRWRDVVDDDDRVARALLGPVCVAASERGSGLFRDLYAGLLVHSRDLEDVAEGVVLIHADNAASLAAHSKLAGCREAGRFRSTDDRPWVVLVLDLEAARADLRGAD